MRDVFLHACFVCTTALGRELKATPPAVRLGAMAAPRVCNGSEGVTRDCPGLASGSRDNLGFFDAHYLECYQAARRTLQSQKLQSEHLASPAGDPGGAVMCTSESEEPNDRASMPVSQAFASTTGAEAPLLPWCNYCCEQGHHSPPYCCAFDSDVEERRNLGLDNRCQLCGHFGHYERACVTPSHLQVHYCFRCKAWGHEQGYGCDAGDVEETFPIGRGYWRDRPDVTDPSGWREPCGRCGCMGHSRQFCETVQCPYCRRWGSWCPAPRCLRK